MFCVHLSVCNEQIFMKSLCGKGLAKGRSGDILGEFQIILQEKSQIVGTPN